MQNLNQNNRSRLDWSDQEEQQIRRLFERLQLRSWKIISQMIHDKFPKNNRTAKQCRQRYFNFIKFKKTEQKQMEWLQGDSMKLFSHYSEKGSKWNQISKAFENRSSNQLKNKFHSLMKIMLTKLNESTNQLNTPKKRITYKTLLRAINSRQREANHIWNGNMRTCYCGQQLTYKIIKHASRPDQMLSIEDRKQIISQLKMFNKMTQGIRLQQNKRIKAFKENSRIAKHFQKMSKKSSALIKKDDEKFTIDCKQQNHRVEQLQPLKSKVQQSFESLDCPLDAHLFGQIYAGQSLGQFSYLDEFRGANALPNSNQFQNIKSRQSQLDIFNLY